jgi:hypothetical protein
MGEWISVEDSHHAHQKKEVGRSDSKRIEKNIK